MKQRDIDVLIGKYYLGKTSRDEEAFLKDCLKNNQGEEYNAVHTQLQVMEDIYGKEGILDKSFDEKILREISTSKHGKTKRRHMQRTLSGVAATILVLVSIWAAGNLFGTKEAYGTINDPIAAFAETKKALQKVSGNVNKGISPATITIKKAESGLNKTKKLKNINKLKNTGLLLKSMTKVTVDFGKS